MKLITQSTYFLVNVLAINYKYYFYFYKSYDYI